MTDETRARVVKVLRTAAERGLSLGDVRNLLQEDVLVNKIARDAREHALEVDRRSDYTRTCAAAAAMVEEYRWP